MVKRTNQLDERQNGDGLQNAQTLSELEEQVSDLSAKNEELCNMLETSLAHLHSFVATNRTAVTTIEDVAGIAAHQLDRFVFVPGSAIAEQSLTVQQARNRAGTIRGANGKMQKFVSALI